MTPTLLLALLACSLALAQDFTGRWTGVADTIDETGEKRQERHTLEIKSEDGKLTAARIGKNGKAGAAMQVQTDGAKIQLIEFLPSGGGEPLRWKLTLIDEKLTGKYQVLHDDPKKWQYVPALPRIRSPSRPGEVGEVPNYRALDATHVPALHRNSE